MKDEPVVSAVYAVYQARGIKPTYCKPFNAQVKHGLIVRNPQNWGNPGSMYRKAKWMAKVVTLERKHWWSFLRVKDWNYIMILYCPFCGKEL